MSKRNVSWTACAIVLLALSGATGSVSAQSTTSSIFGQAPAGESVLAQNSNGLHRHTTVNGKGRYTLNNLPGGDYSVVLQKDGAAVDTRQNISILAGRNAEVDFACPDDHCATH